MSCTMRQVIPICVLVLYSVLSCMIVSVTASVYGCTLDETPVIAPKLHFSPLPQNRKTGVCTEYKNK